MRLRLSYRAATPGKQRLGRRQYHEGDDERSQPQRRFAGQGIHNSSVAPRIT